MDNNCSICGKFADVALSVDHDVCGHRSHADCLGGEDYNFDYCQLCLNGKDAPPGAAASAAAVRMAVHGTAEPRTTDGVNYILNPGRKQAPSTMLKVAAWVPGLATRVAETIENTRNPEFLLRHRVPILDIMRNNHFGLEHFLKAGVTMQDFLTNCYTWDDLLLFEDISGRKGAKLPLKAITFGLQANANHFRTYADAFPYQRVRAHTQFAPHELGELFGLFFPEDGAPLQCEGNMDWNARDCVELGLTMDDLRAMGLEYAEQYDMLLDGLTARDAREATQALGVTKEHLAELLPPPTLQMAPPPVVLQRAPAQAVAVVEAPMEEEEEYQPPPRVVRVAPVVVQAQQQVHHQAPRPRRGPAGPTTAPAAAAPAREQRFERHGALLYSK